MSLIYMDGFGHLATGEHINGSEMFGDFWYLSTTDWQVDSITTGRNSIRVHVNGPYSVPNLLRGALGGDYTTLVVGIRFQTITGTSQPTNASIFRFLDTTTIMGLMRYNWSTGQMYYDGGAGFTATETQAETETAYWEIKVVFHNSAGEVHFWKNGVAAGSTTGIDTLSAGTACDNFDLCAYRYSQGDNQRYSDFYIDDANNHGDSYVTYEPCDTSGSLAQWTPLASTNESQVDEYATDEDTTYNSSDTPTDKDQLTHAAATSVGNISGVMALARVKKDGAGLGSVKLGVLHSGTEEQGSARALGTDYDQMSYMQEDVPGGTGWTGAQLIAAETSIERTA